MEMQRVATIKSDLFAYLWLLIGAALFMLSTGRFGVALAAWLAPVPQFLLSFSYPYGNSSV
jgi:hypothetical protein